MKIGVVAYGNGYLSTMPDGTTNIAEAIWVQSLTGDFALVETKIKELTWQRGFTNLAQGFHMADVLLSQTGRADAQSAVMVIGDGKYSMAYQTKEKVQELKDKSVMVFLVPISEAKGPDLEEFRSFSSFPHETNYLLIPGLDAVKFNAELFAGQVIAKFCPMAFSPSTSKQKDEENMYMMIHMDGYPSDECGKWTWHGKGFTIDECRHQAMTDERMAFAFGKGKYMQGGCYSEGIEVNEEMWGIWLDARMSIPCAEGTWIPNPYFDTYALKP